MPAALRGRVRYQLALLWIANGDFDLAQLELFKVSQTDSNRALREAAALAHGLLLSYRQNWPESAAIFAQAREQARLHLPRADTLQNVVAGLQQLAQKPQRKSPHTAKWLSTFLPGSGQVYAGHWLKGINALGLNAMTSYALWQNIERRHFRDAVLVFSFLWMRYYLGNRAHAEEAAILANQSYQEKIMRQVYRSLEQNVRLMPAERLTLDWEDLQ
jgi:hypothetical protein